MVVAGGGATNLPPRVYVFDNFKLPSNINGNSNNCDFFKFRNFA